MSNQPLRIDDIRTDGGTQSRAQTNWLTVTDYAAEMAEGATFPPVVVFHDGAAYWLADGFHRIEAAKRLGLVDVDADVRAGSQRDALLYSVGANAKHGLRRTNDDKRRAVELLLSDAEWSRWSDVRIADMCGVSSMTVGRIRAEAAPIINIVNDAPRLVERNGQTYTMNTANIGRAPIDEPSVPAMTIPDDDAPVATLEPAPPADNRPHVAYNAGDNEWYTPAEYIAAAREVMGAIDLDPATTQAANKVVGAKHIYTADDDGLLRPWRGRVWMNPPYAAELVARFCDKLALHVDAGDVPEAIVLVNNATETAWFNTLASVASAVVFPRGRVRFWHPTGKLSAPLQGQAIVYIGAEPELFLNVFRRFGWGGLL